MSWVIEASESPLKNPAYFTGFSSGRCYLHWSDEFGFAKKFESKIEAEEFAAKNRINCGFRIKSKNN